ncbi:MAG TPA: RNA 2',3'-cyclic phosphodiesterase [Nitrospiria bacterium]|nr:RNA 2',3'-cyclic phosphodiesterase [Nitrospiria bacterium]
MRAGGRARTGEDRDAVRSFVAVHVPESWAAGLAALRDRLARGAGGIRWVQPDGAHVTLAFLGDVPAARVPALAARLRDAGRECAPCRVSADAIGVFPHPGRAAVLWLGIKDPAEGLRRLQGRVQVALGAEGFAAEDRPFHPHVTLGRWRTPPSRDRVEALLATPLPLALSGGAGEWVVTEIRLMASQLAPEGPVYTVMAALPLTGSAPG